MTTHPPQAVPLPSQGKAIKLLQHTTTDTSIAGFEADWKKAFGNNTILELLKK